MVSPGASLTCTRGSSTWPLSSCDTEGDTRTYRLSSVYRERQLARGVKLLKVNIVRLGLCG